MFRRIKAVNPDFVHRNNVRAATPEYIVSAAMTVQRAKSLIGGAFTAMLP